MFTFFVVGTFWLSKYAHTNAIQIHHLSKGLWGKGRWSDEGQWGPIDLSSARYRLHITWDRRMVVAYYLSIRYITRIWGMPYIHLVHPSKIIIFIKMFKFPCLVGRKRKDATCYIGCQGVMSGNKGWLLERGYLKGVLVFYRVYSYND